jgi:hypothetical protein
MIGCESFQAQLLAYLYDLLDGAERQSLQDHLDQCGDCQAALARAQGQQRLLATAAKSAFPAVHFQPPAPEREQPVVVPMTAAPPAAGSRWPGYAIAASILVLLSLGLPAAWWTLRYRDESTLEHELAERAGSLRTEARQVALDHRQSIARTDAEAQTLQQKLAELEAAQPRKMMALWEDVQKRQLHVIVSGPESILPGAPNAFQIRTQDLTTRPVAAHLSVRVLDQNKQVVYERKEIESKGDCRLILPPTLPLKPHSQLSLEVAARSGSGPETQVRAALPLAAPVYLTHLTTDKPMYLPGETVHFRSLTLERFTLKPASEDFRLVYSVTDPNGQEVFHLDGASLLHDSRTNAPVIGPDGKQVRGIGAGEFPIQQAAAGGEYALTVREGQGRFPEQQRKFIVNRYERPRLNKKLDFTRKTYGPSDDLVAACECLRAEGGPVAQRPVAATMQIDGKWYGTDGREGGQAALLQTDAEGRVNVRFKLPTVIDRGQASLTVQFNDGGSWESLVRPVPIVLKKLQVEFFPEGGDLVAGVPNRVYFQVRSTLGKPAELKGRVVDQEGRAVALDVHTLNDDKEPGINQGMGLFAFTPQAGHKYELKIDAPSGIEGKYELPAIKADGVVLSIPEGVMGGKDPLRVVVESAGKDRRLLIGAYCRGRLMDNQTVTARKGEATVITLQPGPEVGGVYRVTAFEDRADDAAHPQFLPVAERLVYRKPVEQLILTVKPDKNQYIPGERVKLAVTGLDEHEQPAPAIVMVAVVDKSVITMADEKTARTMPTHYYLTTECRRPEDLEYADVLLTTHPKAAQALDLLLGTQGWRRFAEQDPGIFRQKFGPDADRLLVTLGQAPQEADSISAAIGKLQTDYATEHSQLQEAQQHAQAAQRRAHGGADLTARITALQKELTETDTEHRATALQLEQRRAFLGRALQLLLIVASASLVVGMGIVVARRLDRESRRPFPYSLATAVWLGLIVGLVLYLPWDQPNTSEPVALYPDINLLDELAVAPQPQKTESQPVLPLSAVPPPPMAPMMDDPRAFGMANGVGKDGKGGARPETVPQAQEKLERELAAGAVAPEARRGLDEQMAVNKNQAVPLNLAFADKAKGDKAPEAIRRQEAGQEWKHLQEGQFDLADRKRAGAEKEPPKDAQLRLRDRELMKIPAPVPAVAMARKPMPLGRPGAPMGNRPGGLGGGIGGFGGLGGGGAGRGGPGWGYFQGGLGGMPAGARMAGGLQAERIVEPPPPPMLVREFAYQRQASASDTRANNVDTVYWHPALVLPGGKAELSFDLCQSVTTFQVTAFGHTLDGRLGAVTTGLESRLPFTLEPKLPIEVTASDTIEVPVSIANNTDTRRAVWLRTAASGLNLSGKDNDQLLVDAQARTRRIFRFQPAIVEGQAKLEITGQSVPFSDAVSRTFTVVPDGFPVVQSRSDVLESVARQDVLLPETWVKGTLQCRMQVYPSTLADLQKGLESLLREPCGCFEQTSTSNYPNVLILDYLKESDQVKPEVERRARELLSNGYQKLTSFECLDTAQNKRRGYEWFGGVAAPHEALTAYGLLEFRDMARVYEVDPKMIERTRQYLMASKDGQGGFRRNPAAIDTFGRAPENITNAYIVWALTESGKEDDVEKELTALANQAKTSNDPYFLALVATSLINRGKSAEGVALLKTVAAAQKDDGHLDAAQTSITGSGGRDLQIETTALAALGWLKANRPADFNLPVQKAIRWLGQQRGGYGGFGSTQSTILALKAIIAYAKANKKTPEGGELQLFVGTQVVAQQKFPAGVEQALVLDVPEPDKHLKPGKNPVRVEITGKNVFPYTLTWTYRTLKPISAAASPLRLSTHLDRNAANEGESVRLTVTVENTQDKGQGMAVAIVGLPAGLTLPEDMKQLKEHATLRNAGKEKGLIGAWETRGREVILYWRDLAPKQKIEVPLDLICRVPGTYRGPASRAYLYYNADLKDWVEPLTMTIKAKGE